MNHSVYPSVCADSCLALNSFFALTLAYHIWIWVYHMRQCVMNIHDINTILTSDLRVNFIAFFRVANNHSPTRKCE